MTTALIHPASAAETQFRGGPRWIGSGKASGRPSRALLFAVTITLLALSAGCAGATAGDSSISISATAMLEHSDQGPAGLPSPHVHGVAVNPGDDRVYLATHDGLFRYDPTGPIRVSPIIDLMGFTVAGPNHFYASGHPGEGTDLPNPVGLIASTDAGQTWNQLSRQGQSDFHALSAGHLGILGNDGTLRVTQDGQQWRDLQVPLPPTALAASPVSQTVLAATDAGLLRSVDAAQTWVAPPGAPPLKVLAWTGDGTAVGATFDGAVYVSTDAGLTWQRRGRTPPLQAIAAADELRILVVTSDQILESEDGGITFTPLQNSGR